MDKILEAITHNKLYMSIIVIVLAIIVYNIISRIINKIIEKDLEKHKRLDKKGRTIIKLLDNIIKYVVIIIVIILILKIHGINVNSLVAGLGIVSVIAGLAIQDPLKDIISGVNIIADDYFALGDIVKVDDIEGKVIEMGVRTSKIKDIKNGNILVIANRNISKTIKLSEELYLDIPLSYEDKLEELEKILKHSAELISKEEKVINAEYLGVNEFADSCINYKMKILCKPENRFSVKRTANRIIKLELDKNGISIPYPQLTIHNGK